ncbi:hypothetical protein CGMCC3_g4443 [Colletotrichum fructicola]|nr:uncharacterized protein CGMCC3_g4443 [Colletotrichum fructicola]KAE9579945.1 hypothetical protein CGMCC3_g4443 [Colletotrichum fructicola]
MPPSGRAPSQFQSSHGYLRALRRAGGASNARKRHRETPSKSIALHLLYCHARPDHIATLPYLPGYLLIAIGLPIILLLSLNIIA